MSASDSPTARGPVIPPDDLGQEKRSGLERRRARDPQPPPGHNDRRRATRRKADRITLEGMIRIGASGGRLHRRVNLELPVIFRPLHPAAPDQTAMRGQTLDLAPGGAAIAMEEEFAPGTRMEVMFRFEGDLLAADVEVVRVTRRGNQFLHHCRFSRLGAADRGWLTEYLRRRETPPA